MNSAFKIYLVGGAVRDALLNRPVTEKDWVVVGGEPNDLLKLGYTQVGKDFPVFLHPKTKDEYALARIERKQGKGYTGFVCNASKTVTLEDDLYRRDLTINAMAQSPQGDIIDPYNGLTDLNARLLRHVSSAFREDPLRILRVARFAARYAYLGFHVAPDTMELMEQMAKTDELSTLPSERVWRETEKAMSEQTPSIYFDVLYQCTAMSSCFSSIQNYSQIQDLASSMNTLYEQTTESNNYSTDTLPQQQCALFSLAISEFTPSKPTAWLTQIKAPNSVVYLSETVIKIASCLREGPLTEDSLLTLFNNADVWRKESVFLDALDVIAVAPWFVNLKTSKPIATLLKEILDAAKQVTAQSVMSDTIKGPLIRQEMNKKRQEYIGEALKLW